MKSPVFSLLQKNKTLKDFTSLCFLSIFLLSLSPLQYGLKSMLESDDGIPLLVKAINPSVPHMMVDAVKLLSAISILEHPENL